MTLLTSAVIAAIVSGLVALLAAERRIAAENVIQERMKWRDKVRALVSEARSAMVESEATILVELEAQFALHLNPHDQRDQQILSLIVPDNSDSIDELTQRVSLLLKHDWERAKYEASLHRWLCEAPPERVAFENYERGRPHDYRRWRPWVSILRTKIGGGRNVVHD
jgi:hypothetical protein